jgi:poly(3-hydroxybutyrate) depolymerase
MMYTGFHRAALIAAAVAGTAVWPDAARAQRTAGTVLDESAPPGPNYDKAEFRLWMPPGSASVRGTLVLVPGSNGDGRAMAEDSVWQAFAAAHRLAIVACRFTDKPHDQNFIEEYVNVSHGSGQALIDALSRFAVRASHPELSGAPLLFWGMSAGGQFDYEFAAWKPERVIAFVVNKGGIYYTALTSPATRRVPAMLFVGGKDLEFRTNTIVGLFAVNRRGGALWALAEEPDVAHVVGRSRDLSLIFFDDVLPLRLGDGEAGGTALKELDRASGLIGDLKAKTVRPSGNDSAPAFPTAWLPTARVARGWQAMSTGAPFER